MSSATRVLLVVASVAIFAACSGGDSTGTTPDGTPTTSSESALSGAWDINLGGRHAVPKGSQVTFNGLSVTGTWLQEDEGLTLDGCTHVKSRTDFTLQIQGDALSGTLTPEDVWSGANNCPTSSDEQVVAVVGSRTGGTGYDGEWNVTAGHDTAPFVVTINGLTAQGWDKQEKADGRDPTFNAAVANGTATVVTHDDDLSITATKR